MSLIRTRLSVMMFLEFFIWGAWLPLIFGYLPSLGFSPLENSWILNAFAIASVVGMFFSNQFADRNFAAEKFLAFSQLVGGIAILGIYFVQPGWRMDLGGMNVHLSFWAFFLLMLVHSLFYVPTISITNSIAFANVADPQKDFGLVRLWGTIGWIAASWPFVFILVDWAGVDAKLAALDHKATFVDWLGAALGTPAGQEGVKWTYVAAGVASLLLAGFSLFLPHTPPKRVVTGEAKFAWLEAMSLLKIPFVLVLFVVTFVDAAVHQCYFIWTNNYLQSVGIPANWVMPAMSIGQIAEIGTMAILGMCLKGLGWRNIMVLGILGHALRFGMFSLLPNPYIAVGVNVVHGICYAFFFATVYIFVDEFFPKDARSSAQGLFNFLILGVGPFIANFVWPQVGELVKTVDVEAQVVQTSGQNEVMLSGMVKSPTSPPLGMLHLQIQKPGESQATEYPITLDADSKFQLALGAPESGTYTVVVPWRRDHWLAPDKDVKTKVELKVGDIVPGKLPKAQAKDFDYQRLFLFPSGTAVVAAILLALFFHPPQKRATEDEPEEKPPVP